MWKMCKILPCSKKRFNSIGKHQELVDHSHQNVGRAVCCQHTTENEHRGDGELVIATKMLVHHSSRARSVVYQLSSLHTNSDML